MTRRASVLMMANAHGLDLLTLMLLVPFGIAGEFNPVARLAYAGLGIAGLILLKVAGTAFMVSLATGSRLRTGLVVLAGLVGAVINLWALFLLRG